MSKPITSAIDKLVPNRKVEIQFIKDTTTTVVGNAYIGKKATLNIATAKLLVNGGVAKFTDAKEAEADAQDDSGDDEKMTLEEALESLDHSDDAHWTQSGLPDLNVIKELTGKQIKRSEVEAVAPELTREEG